MEDELILLLLREGIKVDTYKCRYILNNNKFSIEWFVTLLFRHKIAAYITDILLKIDLLHEIHPKWNQVLISYLSGNRKRNEIILDGVTMLFTQLNANCINYAVLNGLDYILNLYTDLGCRFMKDIDILVDQKQITDTCNIFEKLGYKQLEYNNSKLTEISHKEKLFKICAHNVLSPYIYVTGQELCPYINIEIAFDIFPKFKNRSNNGLNEQTCENIIVKKYNNLLIRCLNNEMKLIQMAIHIYNDSIKMSNIINGKGDELIKYLDMYLLIVTENINWATIISLSTEYKINDILYYAFYHLNLLFSNIISSEIIEKIMPKDLSIIDRFGAEDENKFVWKLPFLERIFSINKSKDAESEIEKATEYKKYIDLLKEIRNV